MSTPVSRISLSTGCVVLGGCGGAASGKFVGQVHIWRRRPRYRARTVFSAAPVAGAGNNRESDVAATAHDLDRRRRPIVS